MQVDRLALPADVRDATPQSQAVYEAALQFEQVLVTQLAEAMVPEGDGGAGLAQQLPSALAQGITDAGGVGLARTIWEASRP
jgi:hypothetical protein